MKNTFYTSVDWFGGDYILLREVVDGVKVDRKVKFQPSIFLPDANSDSEYKSLSLEPLRRIICDSITVAKERVEYYKGLSNGKIYGFDRWKYQFIAEEYPDKIHYKSSDIDLWTIDIETTTDYGQINILECPEEITCITLQNFNTKIFNVFTTLEYTQHRDDVCCVHCHDEEDLLTKFLQWWTSDYPHAISGWNTDEFDVPYICRRIETVLGEKAMRSLSPFNKVTSKELTNKYGKRILEYTIAGVTSLDYHTIYRNPGIRPHREESYKLDFVANLELDMGKIENPYDTLKEFYTEDPQRFVEYNIRDTELITLLEDKIKLIQLLYFNAYDNHACYLDSLSQVRLWDVIIHKSLLDDNIIVPWSEVQDKAEKYEGAYVKEPIPGLYNWVVSWDMTSLYPSIIRLLGVSPETLLGVEQDGYISVDKVLNGEFTGDDKPYSIAPNGARYDNNIDGIIPRVTAKVFTERSGYKAQMIEYEQQYELTNDPSLKPLIDMYNLYQNAKKINGNALYGGLGNPYFRYYRVENAVAITSTGQLVIRWAQQKLNAAINKMVDTKDVDYCFYSDTDSIYVTLDAVVKELYHEDDMPSNETIVETIDQLCKCKIAPYLDKIFNQLMDILNAKERTLSMKREVIGSRGIWTAKKRYAINVYNSEGVQYKKPKIKVLGLQCVQTNTPKLLRGMIKDSIKIILTGTPDELLEFIKESKATFYKQSLNNISSSRNIKGLDNYHDERKIHKKGAPFHVKAALFYNHYIKHYKLEYKYPLIENGDSVKVVYLEDPNPIHHDAIAYVNEIPPQFKLDNFLGYGVMWNKFFISPLRSLTDVLDGWGVEKRGKLW